MAALITGTQYVLSPHSPTLRRGSTGAAVREAQELLARAGFSPGRVDGIFSAYTEAAVRAFQKAKALEPDGCLGVVGWHVLRCASGVHPQSAAPVSNVAVLAVPFLSQLTVPDGYASTASGPTSLAMVMAHSARTGVHVLDLARSARTRRDAGDTSHAGMLRAAEHHGFYPQELFGWAPLVQALELGQPVIARVFSGALVNRPYSFAGAHYLVVIGLVREGPACITDVVCNDPATSHPERGAAVRYPATDFEAAWSAHSRWMMTLL